MSITSVFSDKGRQAVYIPNDFRFNTHNVFVERVDNGILVRPVSEHPSFADLFAMMDAAQQEEGLFEVDRADNQIPSARGAF